MTAQGNAPVTGNNYQSYLQYLKTHHFTKAQRNAYSKAKRKSQRQQHQRGRRHASRAMHKAGGRHGAPSVATAEWISNPELPTCIATAVANSLLAETGIRVSEWDVLALHDLGGGDERGATLIGVMDAVLRFGLAGHYPVTCTDGFRIAVADGHATCLPPGEPGNRAWDELWSITWT